MLAEPRQARIKLALQGRAGSGKIYAELLLAYGPPYSPERYIQAIETCERAGAAVINIDSIASA